VAVTAICEGLAVIVRQNLKGQACRHFCRGQWRREHTIKVPVSRKEQSSVEMPRPDVVNCFVGRNDRALVRCAGYGFVTDAFANLLTEDTATEIQLGGGGGGRKENWTRELAGWERGALECRTC